MPLIKVVRVGGHPVFPEEDFSPRSGQQRIFEQYWGKRRFDCGFPTAKRYALSGMLSRNFVMRPWEEADLERRFGEPFHAYRLAVRCWIPRLQAYEERSKSHAATNANS